MDSTGRQYADPMSYSGVSWNTTPQATYQQPAVYYQQTGHTYQQSVPHTAPYPYQNPAPHPQPHPQPQPQPQPHPHVAPVSQHQHQQHQQHHNLLPAPTAAPQGQSEPNENYETSVYVGLEDAPPEFRLAFRVIGEKGQNLEYLSRTTGAKVILRGRGTGIVNNKPLHIYVGHATLEGKEEAESLANNLVRAVKEEYADWRKSNGLPTGKPASAPAGRTANGNRLQGKPPHNQTRPNEMRELTITRDPVGRVKVRQEDRRVVQIQRPDQSALSRLGPRVDDRPGPIRNREQQVPSHHHQMALDRPVMGGERRRDFSPRQRSRSPLNRQSGGMPRPPKQIISGEQGRLSIEVGQGLRRDEEDRGPRTQDSFERSRDLRMREERIPKDNLTITASHDNRNIRAQELPDRRNSWNRQYDDDSRRDRREISPQRGRFEDRDHKDREFSPPRGRFEDRGRRDLREFSPERRHGISRASPPRYLGRHERDRQKSPPASHKKDDADFGLASRLSRKTPKGVPTVSVWGTTKRPAKFFVPGLQGQALEDTLEKQQFDRLNPIFVVRKGPTMTSNYIWVLGDTALYVASQRAAEHPEGPNLGIPKTMILWFGFPALKLTSVAAIIKSKLGRNLNPDAIILHVGGEDIVNYIGKTDTMERDMKEMVSGIKKLLPHTHLSWSNVLPWKHYPSKVKPQVLEDIRNKMNDTAKQLMKQHKGSTLYHDHDFRARKDGLQVYHKSGFYPSEQGAKCMVLNFMSIIKDLVAVPAKD